MKLNSVTSLLIASIMITSSSFAATCPNPVPVWQDEFNGTSLDTTKWVVQTGDGCSSGLCGWGNNELESYQAANVTVANGLLNITAKKQRVGSKAYTSGRITTQGIAQWTNGRFEARIKMPTGAGMWPAFWMLPTNPSVGWPMSGEIDIAEMVGQASMVQFGTIHYGASTTTAQYLSTRIVKQPDNWSDAFHTYAVNWTPNKMEFYVDDMLYATYQPTDMSSTSLWTFENYKYNFILNLAVGGNLGGTVDNTKLPQTMLVDYVRAYDFSQPNIAGARIVEPNSTQTYSVIDEMGTSGTYSWTSPSGQTSTGKSIAVNFGTTGGAVTVNGSNSCGSYSKTFNVAVLPTQSLSYAMDDFESNRHLSYTTVTGSLNQSVSNPAPSTVNNSAVVAQYVRNATAQYDLITASTTAITNAAPFLTGDKSFYLDVYTPNAPIGTEILIQLENSSTATSSNYPTGRHSKYVAYTKSQNAWDHLKFTLLDRLDAATTDTQVNQIVLMLADNSLTGYTFYLDNYDIFAKAATTQTSVKVSAVTTSYTTVNGLNYPSAQVTVVDNNGNVVPGAVVTGNFTGTVVQSGAQNNTNNSGIASVGSSTGVSTVPSVSFCVSNVSQTDLTFNKTGSVSVCP